MSCRVLKVVFEAHLEEATGSQQNSSLRGYIILHVFVIHLLGEESVQCQVSLEATLQFGTSSQPVQETRLLLFITTAVELLLLTKGRLLNRLRYYVSRNTEDH